MLEPFAVRIMFQTGLIHRLLKILIQRGCGEMLRETVSPFMAHTIIHSSSGSRGCQGPHGPSGSVKISHKKDGRQRQPHKFHVSWSPWSRWIRYCTVINLAFLTIKNKTLVVFWGCNLVFIPVSNVSCSDYCLTSHGHIL